jgi:hypothetical protein
MHRVAKLGLNLSPIPPTTSTASNTGLPGVVPYYLIVTCLGPDCHDIPRRCYGVPDLLLVPAHPPADGPSNTKGSADTVCYQRYVLRVAPLAMVLGWKQMYDSSESGRRSLQLVFPHSTPLLLRESLQS